MFKKILIFIVFILTSNLYGYYQIHQITPFITDIKGVNAYDEIVIAYGSDGVAYSSYDNGDSWKEIIVDQNENIVNLVSKNDYLLAFLENGNIKKSFDEGKTWNLIKNANDSIIYSNVTDDYNIVRTQHMLITFDNDFNISNQIELEYFIKVNYDSENTRNNEPPFQIHNNKIYTFLKSNILIYDMNLNLLENIPSEEDKSEITRIYVANNKIYFAIKNELKEINEERKVKTFLKFEKNKELFSEVDPNIYHLRVFNNSLYSFNAFKKNNLFPYHGVYKIEDNIKALRIGEVDCSVDLNIFYVNDIAKLGNIFYFVSDSKFIVKYDASINLSLRLTDFTNFSSSGGFLPIRIEDDLAIYRNGTNFYTLNPKTSSVSKIINDTIFSDLFILFEDFLPESEELIILGYDPNHKSELILFTSIDLGKSFKKIVIFGYEPLNYIQITGFKKIDEGYMISSYFKSFISHKNEIKLFDENFNEISSSMDSVKRNLSTGYMNGIYYRINQDTSFFKKTYLQTSLNHENWEDLVVFSHSKSDTTWLDDENFVAYSTPDFRISKEVKAKNLSYLINFIYSENDSIFIVQRVDIKNKEIDTLINNKINTYDFGITDAFDFYKDTLNIVVNDTLYLLNVYETKDEFEKISFPDNGAVVQRSFKRFATRNFFTYIDDKHKVKNYWFNLNRDNGTSSIEEINSPFSYFFNSAPYPQPTRNYVTTDIYLDKGVKLTKDDIRVFDVNGTQVETGTNIEISGTDWPAKITWDSSNQPVGIYFIVIDFSGNLKAIKVIKQY